MALTQNQYTGNGNTVLFNFTFPYLSELDVKVKLDGVTQPTTAYSFANATTVQMNTAPANGVIVLIFRDTSNDSKKATFYPGSAIKAEDLNDNIDQILYVAQEVDNNAMSTLGDDAMQGDLNLDNNKITNLGNPTSGTDGVNKTTLDSSIDTAIESDILVGTDLSKSASSGQVTISHNVSGANTTINNSDGNVIQDITISAQGHVTSAGSVNLDGRYYTETELDAGQLDNRYYTETELNNGSLDTRYYTETELNNGILDTRYYTETELNNGQLDSRYFRQDSSETITGGATWSASDSYVATTSAIDARIIDLIDDVGGFVPIANETSFPTANPDVNNGSGTLVSIKSISSTRTPSSGTVTISNAAGSETVTITGCGSTVLTAGFGVIVETTSTQHTYAFHRLVPKATEVSSVAGISSNITTVANNTSNINAVAGDASNISTVAGAITNVNNVGNNISNVNSVAGNETNINAVQSNASNINAVAGINANVTTVAGSISNVNTAASNISQIQNFADVYRIVSSDPSDSLNTGDLIFNTTTNKFKVYDGSAWVDAVARQFSDNTDMLFGNTNDLAIRHDGTHSKVHNNTGSLLLETDSNSIQLNKGTTENMVVATIDGSVDLYFSGNKKLETTLTGASVTGALGVGITSPLSNNKLHLRLGDASLGSTPTSTASVLLAENSGNSWITVASGASSYGGVLFADSGQPDRGQVRYNHNGDVMQLIANEEKLFQATLNGASELYFDNTLKQATVADGIDVFNRVRCLGSAPSIHLNTDATGANTSSRAMFGLAAGNNQFIAGAGSNDVVLNTPHRFLVGHASNELMAVFDPDGASELYYDAAKKFYTHSLGAVLQNELFLNNGNSNVFFNSDGSSFYGACPAIGRAGGDNFHMAGTATGDIILAAEYQKKVLLASTNNTSGQPSIRMTVNPGGQIDGDFNDTSDANLKENINPIPDNAIADIKKLKPVTFDWKETNGNNNVSGFIAQDVKEVIPNLINGKEWSEEDQSSRYTINTIGVVAHLTKALQEAIAKIETLETKVAALEAK